MIILGGIRITVSKFKIDSMGDFWHDETSKAEQ